MWARERLQIKYRRNEQNLGRVRNYLQVIEMADGEFVWFLGDDDLLLPNTLEQIRQLIDLHPDKDFFYVNAYHLSTEFVASFPQPFNTCNLPKNMKPFSARKQSGALQFMELVDPEVSFDFLGGFFLAVFRRELWLRHVDVLDQQAILDLREFSHYDNTFPHVKVFAKAFANSKAYFHADPLSVCLTGAREWSPMYGLVHGVRLIESLGEFRKNGLPLLQYLWCRNFGLNNFAADLGLMLFHGREAGLAYVNPWKLIIQNCLFPNFYLSVFFYVARKLKSYMTSGTYNR